MDENKNGERAFSAGPMAEVPRPQLTKTARNQSLVLFAGLLTTVVALTLVWALNEYADCNIMGWYANYILPMGAVLVGLVASSGYGLVSWLGGVKIRGRLLATVLLLSIISYSAAHYIEFASQGPLYFTDTNQRVTFFDYYHINTISMTWKSNRSNSPGTQLGSWGYGIRCLEIAGFGFGCMLAPIMLMKIPYCEPCRRYKKTKELALIPASVPVRKVPKKDPTAASAYQKEQEDALAQGQAKVESLRALVGTNDIGALQEVIKSFAAAKKETAKLPVRITVALVACGACSDGELKLSLVNGFGNEAQTTPLPPLSLTIDAVRALAG